MSEWQPIETAPKDGTFIFVFTSLHRRALASWQGPKDRANFYGIDDFGLRFDARATGEVVTNWMPLPAPPSPAKQAEEQTR